MKSVVLKKKKKHVTEKFPFLAAISFCFSQLQWQDIKQATRKCINILFGQLVSGNRVNYSIMTFKPVPCVRKMDNFWGPMVSFSLCYAFVEVM